MEFFKEIEVRGKPAVCELIIPLPGESEQTYHDSVGILADNGVSLGTYTLVMLSGNELGRRESGEKFGLKTKYRVLPRQIGEYRGENFFEVEEVCIETNTMPYEAYNRKRVFNSYLGH